MLDLIIPSELCADGPIEVLQIGGVLIRQVLLINVQSRFQLKLEQFHRIN